MTTASPKPPARRPPEPPPNPPVAEPLTVDPPSAEPGQADAPSEADRPNSAARRGLSGAASFARYVVRRFVNDQGLQTAASLTYTSLLGLVPLLAVFLAILSAFPAFAALREDVKNMILAPFAPGASEAVHVHLNTFLDNTRRLGVVGALGIGVTAILMLNTIERTLNNIWRVTERRSFRQRIIIFWALLTLPPLLIAASLSLSGYFFAIASHVDVFGVMDMAKRLTPFFMQAIAFTILFMAAPNRQVRLRDAFVGGVVAALLFEGLKNVFGIYVASAGSQAAIYGALAAIPFFLVWIYAAWTMILIGAEVAAALPEWQGIQTAGQNRRLSSGDRLTAAIGILALLWRRTEDGQKVERDEIEAAMPADSADLSIVLDRLTTLGLVAVAEAGNLVLARDLDEISVYRLQRDMGLALEETPRFRAALDQGEEALAAHALAGLLRSAEAAKADLMSVSVKAVALGRSVKAPSSTDMADRSTGA